ncbi:hypothetical protein C8R47DRAFT_1219706 [Mycena vitilis]|nr:hypothetical protein C8R47DRAFT_1219706 [Mycena vitilis]
MTSSPRATSFSNPSPLVSSGARHAHVAAARSPDNDASLDAMVPPVLRLDGYMHNDEAIHLRISSIEFKTSSHDQGWCSEAGLQSTYAGHSWFQAAIMRSSQTPNANAWITFAEDGAAKLDPKIQFDPGPGPENSSGAPESDTGAGDGAGFVTQLRAGDRVAVVVRAQFPGWTNVLERIEVSVSHSLACRLKLTYSTSSASNNLGNTAAFKSPRK